MRAALALALLGSPAAHEDLPGLLLVRGEGPRVVAVRAVAGQAGGARVVPSPTWPPGCALSEAVVVCADDLGWATLGGLGPVVVDVAWPGSHRRLLVQPPERVWVGPGEPPSPAPGPVTACLAVAVALGGPWAVGGALVGWALGGGGLLLAATGAGLLAASCLEGGASRAQRVVAGLALGAGLVGTGPWAPALAGVVVGLMLRRWPAAAWTVLGVSAGVWGAAAWGAG